LIQKRQSGICSESAKTILKEQWNNMKITGIVPARVGGDICQSRISTKGNLSEPTDPSIESGLEDWKTLTKLIQ